MNSSSPIRELSNQEDEHELSLRDYWETVVRYRFTFILVMLIVLGTSLSMQVFAPKKYSASAKLLSLVIDSEADSMMRAFGRTNTSALDPGTISKIAMSKKVLPQALENTLIYFDLYKQEHEIRPEELYIVENFSENNIRAMISITPDRNSDDILIVSASFNDAPYLCAATVNGLTEALLETLTENNRKTLRLEIDNLSNSLRNNEKEIKNIERELAAIQQLDSSKKFSLDERRLTLRLDTLDAQLSATELKKKEVLDQILTLKSDLGIQNIAFEKIRWVDTSSAMHNKLQNLKFEREELLTRYKPENPSIKKLDNQIQSLEDTLRPNKDEQGIVYVEVDKFKVGVVSRLQQLMAEESAIDKRVTHIENDLKEVQNQIFNAPEEQKRVIDLRKQKEVLEQLQLNLHTTLQTSKIQLLSLNSNFELLERAVPSLSSSSAGVGRYIAIGLAFGMALGFGVVLLLKNLENTLKSSIDLKRNFKYPALIALPKWKEDEILIDEMHPDSRVAEVYGMLRNQIRFSSHNQPEKCLLIASAHQSEGKSITATNLAMSFVLEGNTVLLISADLRRPGSQTIFLDEETQTEGIVEYLEGTSDLDEVIHESEIMNLFIVPTIQRANNPTKLLKNDKFKTLLEHGEENYDVVIVDSPAILPVVDSTMFANYMRGVLVIAQADHTPIHAVQETIDRLEHVNAPIVGLCLNRLNDLRLEYLYHYGTNQYYGYQST